MSSLRCLSPADSSIGEEDVGDFLIVDPINLTDLHVEAIEHAFPGLRVDRWSGMDYRIRKLQQIEIDLLVSISEKYPLILVKQNSFDGADLAFEAKQVAWFEEVNGEPVRLIVRWSSGGTIMTKWQAKKS